MPARLQPLLLTGATGFLGRPLATRLTHTGWLLRLACRREVSMPGGIFMGDIDGATDWGNVLEGCAVVVHLAARVHVMRDETKDPLAEFRRVNVEGTLNLARQAAAAGVRRFVYLSSVKVNGESGAFREDDDPAPQDAYARSKMEAERGLLALSRTTGMEVVIIRPPLVYGPGVKGNFAALMRWVRLGVPLPLGSVRNRRSLVALENLVDFIALCADRERSPRAGNEIFLISDGEDVSTCELLRRVACAHGSRARLMPMPVAWVRLSARAFGKVAVANRLLDSLEVNTSKAKDLLGWTPVVTMEEQLRRMACHDTRS